MGTAHEDEGLEPALVDLRSIYINGIEPFIPVLATDAELTLEIGERILRHAEKTLGFDRRHHKYFGNAFFTLFRFIKKGLKSRF